MKWAARRVQSKWTPEHDATEQTDDRKCRQTLAAQTKKGSFINNDNSAEDNVDRQKKKKKKKRFLI